MKKEMNAFNAVGPWWEKREDEPNIEQYVDRVRDNGEGSLRIGEPLTFTEDMYNLVYVSLVKSMYKDACIAENEEEEERIRRVKIKLLGKEPNEPVVEDFVEEEIVEEAGEYEED